MNKPDHSFSEHVKVPDEWIEKALAIPSARSGKSRVSLFTARRLTAAAGVVLVIGIGIYLYFSARNINMPAVLPSPETTVSLPATEPHTAASQPHTANGTEAAQTPTDPSATSVTVPTEPATAGSTDGATTPRPTSAATAAPTSAPSSAPTQKPTVHSHTDSAVPSVETQTPSEDTSTEYEGQSDNSPPDNREVYVEIAVPLSELNYIELIVAASDETLYYCSLYDNSGRLIGQPDLYSGSHRAMLSGNSLCYSGSLGDYRGTYTYVFYDRHGNILTSGSAAA